MDVAAFLSYHDVMPLSVISPLALPFIKLSVTVRAVSITLAVVVLLRVPPLAVESLAEASMSGVLAVDRTLVTDGLAVNRTLVTDALAVDRLTVAGSGPALAAGAPGAGWQ